MLFSLLHLSAFWGNFENFRPLPLRSLASHHCVLVFCLVESSSGCSPWGLDLLNCSTSFWTMLKKTALFLHGGFPNWGYSCKTGHFSSIVLITFTYLTMLILWLWLNAVAGWQKLWGSTGTSHFFRIWIYLHFVLATGNSSCNVFIFAHVPHCTQFWLWFCSNSTFFGTPCS